MALSFASGAAAFSADGWPGARLEQGPPGEPTLCGSARGGGRGGRGSAGGSHHRRGAQSSASPLSFPHGALGLGRPCPPGRVLPLETCSPPAVQPSASPAAQPPPLPLCLFASQRKSSQCPAQNLRGQEHPAHVEKGLFRHEGQDRGFGERSSVGVRSKAAV